MHSTQVTKVGFRAIDTALVLCFLILLSYGRLTAGTITSTWVGGTGDFSNPLDWSPAGIPEAGYQVLFDNTTPLSVVTVDIATATLNNVGIASQASLTLAANLSAGELTSFGAVTVGNGAILNAGTGGFVQDTLTAATTVSAGGSLLDAGTYSQGNGSTLVNGQLTTTLFHVTGGTVTTGATGVLTIGAGGYTQDLAVTTQINSGGQMNLAGDFAQGNGSTIVNGTLSTALLSVTGGTVTVGNGGTLTTAGGGYSQGRPGTATTIAAGGQINAGPGDYSQEISTSTTVDGTLTAAAVNNSGILTGSGVINGDFNDLGTIAPGDGSVGSLEISGNYSQTGFLDIDIDGPGAASILNVGGDATLNGTLDVSLLDGFVPTLGETFLAMRYGSENGTFYDVEGAGLPAGDFWAATYDPGALYLTVETEVPSAPEPATFVLFLFGLTTLLIVKLLRRGPDASRTQRGTTGRSRPGGFAKPGARVSAATAAPDFRMPLLISAAFSARSQRDRQPAQTSPARSQS